jgi:hypothetical protein
MARLLSAALIVPLLLLPQWTAAQEKAGRSSSRYFFAETGVTVNAGDFGTGADTTIVSVPFTLGYRSERWEVSATIPYLSITSTGFVVLTAGGPAAVATTGSPVPAISREVSSNTTSGLGDLTLRGAFFLVPEEERTPSVTPWVSLKLPTADEDEGLGTGEFDVGIGAIFSKTFGRSFGSADLGYVFIGEPGGTDLDDVFSAILTVGQRLEEHLAVYGFLDYRTSVVERVDDPVALGLGAFLAFREVLALRGEFRLGLTESAPDVGGSVSVSYRF